MLHRGAPLCLVNQHHLVPKTFQREAVMLFPIDTQSPICTHRVRDVAFVRVFIPRFCWAASYNHVQHAPKHILCAWGLHFYIFYSNPSLCVFGDPWMIVECLHLGHLRFGRVLYQSDARCYDVWGSPTVICPKHILSTLIFPTHLKTWKLSSLSDPWGTNNHAVTSQGKKQGLSYDQVFLHLTLGHSSLDQNRALGFLGGLYKAPPQSASKEHSRIYFFNIFIYYIKDILHLHWAGSVHCSIGNLEWAIRKDRYTSASQWIAIGWKIHSQKLSINHFWVVLVSAGMCTLWWLTQGQCGQRNVWVYVLRCWNSKPTGWLRNINRFLCSLPSFVEWGFDPHPCHSRYWWRRKVFQTGLPTWLSGFVSDLMFFYKNLWGTSTALATHRQWLCTGKMLPAQEACRRCFFSSWVGVGTRPTAHHPNCKIIVIGIDVVPTIAWRSARSGLLGNIFLTGHDNNAILYNHSCGQSNCAANPPKQLQIAPSQAINW